MQVADVLLKSKSVLELRLHSSNLQRTNKRDFVI